ncbi:MAG: carbohydrate ABC transporter permease [Defluviitaleaceae bacterium]|nr:carbohydrate ABC transporter permease [Defluviitaleaceae bacterium]MCL2837295.1 carbohydrate ABC transporter permease [Defluviitaleaceae bacterium]
MVQVKRRITPGYVMVVLFVGLFAALCLYPFLMVISGSLTSRSAAVMHGFSLIPKEFTTDAYTVLFTNSASIIKAYQVTVGVTVIGTALSLLINSMMAFVVSRPNLYGAKFLNIYVLITMLFSGGIVPWYVICTQYLKLTDTYAALVLPMAASAWNVFLIRNYFRSMPHELYESARVDGASHFRIYRRIYVPLAKPIMATVLLFAALAYWNDWWHGLMLINRAEMQPLQMMLRAVIANIQFLMAQSGTATPWMNEMMARLPSDGVRMALVVITTGPIILVYPFVQRYFVKGIMVGSVKG